jgi:hypothetical protein
MEAFSTLLSAISSVLWPLIVIAAMLLLRPAVIEVIQSAKSRKFTIKIGAAIYMHNSGKPELCAIHHLDLRRFLRRR